LRRSSSVRKKQEVAIGLHPTYRENCAWTSCTGTVSLTVVLHFLLADRRCNCISCSS